MLEVGTFPGVLDGESADISLSIDVKLGVLVEILGLDDATGPELNVEGVSVLGVFARYRPPRSRRDEPMPAPVGLPAQDPPASLSPRHWGDRPGVQFVD